MKCVAGSTARRIAEDRRLAVGGRPQPQDLRAERHQAVVAVGRAMMQGDVQRHAPAPEERRPRRSSIAARAGNRSQRCATTRRFAQLVRGDTTSGRPATRNSSALGDTIDIMRGISSEVDAIAASGN